MNRRRTIQALVLLAVVAVGAAIVFAVPRLPDRGNAVPTTRVTKGPLNLTVHAVGDLRAGRSMTLMAPPVGGMLRVVDMVTTGRTVKSGDVAVEFDPADQLFAVNQAKTEVGEASQEIVKMKADAAAQAAQDQVALLTARFDVRRAELDVSGNEFIGAIDAQKNQLSLEEAKRRLAQLEEDVKSRAETNRASLVVVEEKRNKATLAMQRAQSVIESLQLKAPLDGIVMVKENRDAMGGMMIWGMPMPEYRAGDSVWPGRPVMDVIENGRMELRAKVDENDRTNLTEGQAAVIDVDTIPGRTFKAKVGTLSAPARRAEWEGQTSTRQFDLSFSFDELDPRMRAGASASVTVEGRQIANALTLPRQAVFQKSGKTHVFVKVGERFEQREVKVVQRTESRAAIEGLGEGTEVALIDPTVQRPATSGAAAAPVLGAGGSQ
jgi:multidrug efflux pump subunit AcrA (membrane-fusion protein)